MIKEIFELQNPWRLDSGYQFNYENREILDVILDNLSNNKLIGLVGSRQVGKSSLLYILISHLLESGQADSAQIFYFNLDDIMLHELFTNVPNFIQFIGNDRQKKYVFIDEIQRLENPGISLKEIYDLKLNLKIFYSGSSQLEVKSKLKEHLVGRARQFEIQRLNFNEYVHFRKPITKNQALADILIYGSYPEMAEMKTDMEKKLLLKDIYQSYVQKDVADFLKVDNITAFNKLLVLLANQIGSLLKIDNMANSIQISRATIGKYLSVLENTFIIKRIYPFYKNYKKEITKSPKIYFLDLGLRNFILNNFNPLELRDDVGKLFENFYLINRLAEDHYSMNKINYWRTTNQTEIDFVVEGGNFLEAIEVKWEKKKALPKAFQTFCAYYPDSSAKVFSREDFLS